MSEKKKQIIERYEAQIAQLKLEKRKMQELELERYNQIIELEKKIKAYAYDSNLYGRTALGLAVLVFTGEKRVINHDAESPWVEKGGER